MTNIATGYVAIKADVDDLRKDLDKTKAELESATKKMQGQANKTTKSFKAMWLAYAAGAAIVAATAMKAIKAASDLQETTSKFNTVFKGQQKLAESWGKTLVAGYAMSTRESKFYLSAVQDLLVPMGMAAAEAGKLSFEIVKLSADLGSFNNLPTEQVMLDIQSALVGNFETMKKYGVVLNVAVVTQKALEMGLAATKAELTAGMKAQAAYELMLAGSTAAIGDMARTADGYANTLKKAQAVWEDFMASLGSLILPVATKVLGGLTTMITGMNDFIDTMKSLLSLQGQWTDKTEEWAAAAERIRGEGLEAALGPGAPISITPLAGGGAGGEDSPAVRAAQEDAAKIKALRNVLSQDASERMMEEAAMYSSMLLMKRTQDAVRLEEESIAKDEELRRLGELLQAKADMYAVAEAVEVARRERAAQAKAQQLENDKRLTQQWMSSSLAMAAQHNKQAWRMYQALRVSEAVVDTIEAAQASYRWGASWGGPIGGTAMAAFATAAGMMRVAAIASEKPSYAEGGIARGPTSGYPATLHGTEAIIPLRGGSIPVTVKGTMREGFGKQIIIQLNNPTFQDLEAQNETMGRIAMEITRQLAPLAVLEDYSNDGPIRQMVGGRE